MKKSLPLSSRSIISICMLVAVVAFGTVTAFMQNPQPSPQEAVTAGRLSLKEFNKGVDKEPDAPGQVLTASSGNYTFSTATNASLTDMSSGTTQLVAASQDDTASAVTNIGFDFYFQGAQFSQFSVSSNGGLRLGGVAISNTTYGTLFPVASQSILAPFLGDHTTSSTGKVHYKVTGSAPSRVLNVEWLNMGQNWISSTADGTYQARLYETTGVIEYVYGSMAINGTSTTGGGQVDAVGFASTTGDNNFITVNQSTNVANTTGAPVVSTYSTTGPIANLTSAVNGSRRIYSFTPPTPTAPTTLTFTSVGPSSITLNWLDSPDEQLYAVYRSTDGTNYSFAGTAAQNATSFAATGLAPSTAYFWRVFAVSEGALSGALSGSQSTTAPGDISSTAGGGLWSATGTWVGGVVPTAGDNVTIVDGSTVTIDTAAVGFTLTVGQGASGILQYDQVSVRTLTVTTNVTVAAGGIFKSSATGSTGTVTTNSLLIGGGLTNNGTINFSTTAGAGGTTANAAGAQITFTGASDATFDCSAAAAITNLRSSAGVTLNKGTSATPVLTFTPPVTYTSAAGATSAGTTITVGSTTGLAPGMFVSVTAGTGVFAVNTTVASITNGTQFLVSTAPTTALSGGASVVTASKFAVQSASLLTGATAGFLSISNGTFKVGGTNTFNTPYFNVAAYSIPATGGFWLNNASATVTGHNASPTMSGLLRITAGTYNVGTSSGNAMAGATTSVFNIEGGTMNFSGRLNVTSASASYTQSAGTVNICTVGNASSSTASFGFTSGTSVFTMSGGTINLVQASTGATPLDYNVAGTANVTGGTLNIGTAATATNFNFRIQGQVPALVVSNTTNNKTATLSNTTIVYGNITINTGASLNFNATTGFSLFFLGTSVTNNGTIVGTAASTRFDFQGSGAQTYSGTGTWGTAGIPFQGLGVGVANTNNVTLNSPIITTRVNLFTGSFINSNQITLGSGAALAVFVQRGGGAGSPAGTFDVAPTFNLGTGTYQVTYTTATNAVTTDVEIPATRALTFLVVNNVNGVTVAGGGLSVSGQFVLTLGNLITSSSNLLTVTATTTTSVSGGSTTSYVNGPLARTLPASLVSGSTYTFPVGKGAFNMLELVNPTTNAGGTVVVKAEVFDTDSGGTAGTGLDAISHNRYWNATMTSGAANFTNSSVRLTEIPPSATRIGQSATQAGAYNSIGGTVVGNTVLSTTTTSLDFFAMGFSTLAGGTYTVGAGGTYGTLTAAIADLNSKVITGPVVLSLTDAAYAGLETFPLTIAVNPGSSATNTITIKPSAGASPTITGSAAATCVFNLNGADWVIIDGSNTPGGTTRDLSIAGGNTAASAVVCVTSLGTGAGATNDVVKNTNLIGAADTSSSTTDTFGIFSGGSGTPSTSLDGLDNDNNTFSNNAVTKVRWGIYVRGGSANTNDNNTISGNLLGSTAFNTSRISKSGITVQHQNAISITGNEVRFVGIVATDAGSGTDRVGIGVGDGNWTPTATAITNATVTRNVIHDVVEEKTFSAVGVVLGPSGTSATNNVVANNFIYNVRADGTSPDQGLGIGISSGDGDKVAYNSILMTGDIDPGTSTTATQSEAGIRISSASATNLTLKSNAISMDVTSNTATLKHYAIVAPSAGYAWGTGGSNNNDYFINAANTQMAVGGIGTAVPYTDKVDLAAWQATFTPSQDGSSVSADPQFISATDLHLQGTSSLLSAGASVAGISSDYDNDPRPASNPDIGADELVQAVAGTIPGGTYYNAKTADGDSLGGNVSITNVIYLNGKLSTGANTLAIGCSASVSGGGASNYVIGNLKKTYCATGSKSFEVGTANGFSPVTVNITAGTFPADFTTKAVQGAQPNFAVPAKALSRYWTLTATGVTADLTFNYLDPPDVPGTATEGNFVIFKYNGSFSTPGGTVDTMANTATITGVTSFSDWTLAEPSAEPCPISTTPTSQNFTSAGGSNSFMVTADGSCTWVPVSNNAFITIDSVTAPSGGHMGNGTVNYSVAANTGPARMGTITIGGLTFTVTQNSGCSFMLSSTSQNFVAAGGMDSVNVTTAAGCMWTAVSNDGFITINSGTPGSGNGTVNYTVAANTGPGRMGTMTIAGMTFTVTQNSGCTFMLTPASQNFVAAGGMNSVNVTSGTGCAWTAVSNDAFITVNSGTPGSGNGTVNYTVAANTGPARMGTMTIAGITFNVTQDSGCTFMLTPASQNFSAPGGSNSVNVTQTTSCSWTAVSNDAFIIIDSGASGSGNGTVGYHVTANTGPMRTGTMTIAGITFNATQDAACAFNLSSLSQHFVSTGGMDSVNVITGTGCTWTAVSNDAFIMITMGSSGSGNGTVNYTVAANAGPARMGTMTIAGITFTVSQDSGCMFTLSRNHQSFPGNGGSGSVNVIASDAGCPWTASTTATYIHITSGTPGTGNGPLQYTVDANPGPTIRSDTITIAGQTFTVYQGIDFLDVPSNSLFYTDIGKLAARGVTLGCGSGNYCPNDSVLREQMAAFILRAKGEFNPPTPASQRFTDVPPANVFYNFIDRLAVLGITLGCNPPTNDMYCPGSAVTREQMSAFILRGLGEFSPPAPASQRFNDVPPANVFYNFIDRMAVLNITLGCTPDHLFYCPSDPVTRAQMAAFLVRAFDL